MKKLLAGVGLIVACFVAYFVLISPGKEPQKGQPLPLSEKVSVRIASTSGNYAALLFRALENKHFHAENLEVEIIPVTSGVVAVDMLMAGEIEWAMMTEMAFVNKTLDNSADMQIIASTAEFDNTELVARKDRNISMPADLKGKTIGIVSKSASEYFLLSYLQSHRIGIDEITLVHIPANLHIEAVTSGEVDAVVTWNPHSFKAAGQLGANGLNWSIQEGQKKFWLLAGKRNYLQPLDTQQRLLRALIAAEKDIRTNSVAVRQAISISSGLSEQELAYDWDKINFHVSLPRELLNNMEFEAKWAILQGLTERVEVPNFLDSISFEALDAARPASVTILH